MDVAHAILFAKTIDISRVTADYSSAKFEFFMSMLTTCNTSVTFSFVFIFPPRAAFSRTLDPSFRSY